MADGPEETRALPPDVREHLATWNTYSERTTFEQALDGARRRDDSEGVRVMQEALDRLPRITPLEALAANASLVRLLTGRRWYVIQEAREAGAPWADVGESLGMTGQEARDWYRSTIEFQERYVPNHHDAERARAVL